MDIQVPVIIYTTPICSYCKEAKKLLTNEGIQYQEIDVSDSTARLELVEKAKGRKTVPQIFIKGKHVGGYDDLKVLKDTGDLNKWLENID